MTFKSNVTPENLSLTSSGLTSHLAADMAGETNL